VSRLYRVEPEWQYIGMAEIAGLDTDRLDTTGRTIHTGHWRTGFQRLSGRPTVYPLHPWTTPKRFRISRRIFHQTI